ncbi:MAG: type II toxin-antitoxin system prevent-host-death family antitoxin [Thermodesulfobacteriota bacterium]
MKTAGIKEARQHLTEYLARVEKGEEVIISRRNEPIAIIKPIKKKVRRHLRSHKELRASIIAKGKPLSQVVSESRKEETY